MRAAELVALPESPAHDRSFDEALAGLAGSLAEADEHVLHIFDLTSKFGPCTGLTRLERCVKALCLQNTSDAVASPRPAQVGEEPEVWPRPAPGGEAAAGAQLCSSQPKRVGWPDVRPALSLRQPGTHAWRRQRTSRTVPTGNERNQCSLQAVLHVLLARLGLLLSSALYNFANAPDHRRRQQICNKLVWT